MLVPSAALRARASQGLGTRGAPGLQAPSLSAVSFPTLFRKKEGETCVGAQGQDRAPHSGECGKMEPATWAWHSAWPMKSPVPVGHCTDSTPPVRWCPGTLGWESSRGALPFPPLSPGSSSQPAPQWVMEGSCPAKAPGGVWAVGRGNSCGRQGGQSSSPATGLGRILSETVLGATSHPWGLGRYTQLRRCSAAGFSPVLVAGWPGRGSPGLSGAGLPSVRRWRRCLPADARAPPATGNRGASGRLPLTGDS